MKTGSVPTRPLMWLEGKHILLTGATRGIGRELAKQLVAAGATVMAVARDDEALIALKWELGPQLQTYTCDLQNEAEREQLISELMGAQTPLDGLINNAGMQIEVDYLMGTHVDLAKDISMEVNVNLVAPLHLCAALVPCLAKRPEGIIINVTSALALSPKQDAPVYCATKAGLRNFTTGLRYQTGQLAPNLQISECIMPLVETDMTKGRGRGKISPDRAARDLLQGIKHGADEVWIGKTRLLRIIHRLLPELSARILRG
ncbi:SDR family NAD(P)-dependent oxidoreductase [Rhodobacteraceae bacterium CY05]|uniref:SDR family NAD(P)-dependent oxidoreductase n=2 Tax=Parasedimentitalea huanghaiensis TaxID=2682100 RepID=A0A6L6WHA8_9RHOB|nr:SDR family NAD(P)-dependent oxidoreductase [Zongyanglinia huanghaiensis]